MRTTVDLPPATHRRAKELAEQRGVSLSRALGDLVQRGLRQIETDDDVASRITTDPDTGFPSIDLGRVVTAEEVEAFLDQDDEW